MPAGRFAPSPTGRLHLGNLRTALVAWLFARVDGSPFWLRFEDLDTPSVRREHYDSQQRDLLALGLDWDGAIMHQKDHLARYQDALAGLKADGLLYPCFCSRREIREAVRAPHTDAGWDGTYPGTCRALTPAEQAERQASGRSPAWRLRSPGATIGFVDLIHGPQKGTIHDVIVSRGDGTPAYNLAATLDDLLQGTEVIVRADDLMDQTPAQIHLGQCLGGVPTGYAHVPLVLGPSGQRLAKRDGAVTLPDRLALGESPTQVLSGMAASLGLCEPGEMVAASELADSFTLETLIAALPREPFMYDE